MTLKTHDAVAVARLRSRITYLIWEMKDIHSPGEEEDMDMVETYLNECLAQLRRIRNGEKK